MKPLSFLLVILMLASSLSQPPSVCMKIGEANVVMMKYKPIKDDCCNKNKQNTKGTFCNYCVLCCTFIIPAKTGIQRNFVTRAVDYPEMVQSKLTDFSSPPWRPPNA
jgi:hypothetical protein